MKTESVRRVLGITTKILMWVIVAATVAMMIFTVVSSLTFNRNDRSLFGIRFYIVLSDSMSPSENNKDDKVHFNAGDIVLSRKVKDPAALQPGDIISFVSQNTTSFGETVTHKIRSVETTPDGRVSYVTYGTNTGANDEVQVEPSFVLGKYAGKLPGVGHFFAFMKTVPGYLVCILVPFLLLIIYNGVSVIRLFRRYRREQMAEMQAEKQEIAAQRDENQRMMEELLALKAQLFAQQSASKAETQGTDAAGDPAGEQEPEKQAEGADEKGSDEAAAEPAEEEASTNQSASETETEGEPATEEPVTEEPATEEPATEEPTETPDEKKK